jgi:hypothetical protein
MTSPSAYYYTNTVELPWIIECNELRAGTSRIGGLAREMLWVTTNPNGDGISTAMSPAGLTLWCAGVTQLVRLTVNAGDFVPIPELVEAHTEWTAGQVAHLAKEARAMGEFVMANWLCRSDPLPLARILRAEAKLRPSGRWTEIDLSPERCINLGQTTRGLIIGSDVYVARRKRLSDGNTEYDYIARYPAIDFIDPFPAPRKD